MIFPLLTEVKNDPERHLGCEIEYHNASQMDLRSKNHLLFPIKRLLSSTIVFEQYILIVICITLRCIQRLPKPNRL